MRKLHKNTPYMGRFARKHPLYQKLFCHTPYMHFHYKATPPNRTRPNFRPTKCCYPFALKKSSNLQFLPSWWPFLLVAITKLKLGFLSLPQIVNVDEIGAIGLHSSPNWVYEVHLVSYFLPIVCLCTPFFSKLSIQL